MNYYSPPPATDLPKFMYKGRYGKRLFESLVDWADNEYSTALRSAHVRTAKVLLDEWSGMRVLSQLEHFRWVCAQLDSETWNLLDYKTRKFIRKAYELYELLRK